MAKNTLGNARKAKQDEFYTQLPDIEREMRHYGRHFRNKAVFCNCDDPYESNFFKYFAMNFNHLGLKKLMATCYVGSGIANTQLSLFDDETEDNKTTKSPHKIEITEVTDANGDGAIDLADVGYLLRSRKNTLARLSGNGDFRSPECVELLKEADIVVTNPPFSLFREYIELLLNHEKQFIVIGSKNAISYKEIFKLIKENKIWLGYGFANGNAFFRVPSNYISNFADGVYDETTGLVKFRNVGWYTNLDIDRRHEAIYLYKRYAPEQYPQYDNYRAVEVDKIAKIPYDYDGIMGVPITFLDDFSPEQFEILGTRRWCKSKEVIDAYCGKKARCEDDKAVTVQGKEKYDRIFIRHKCRYDENGNLLGLK